VYENGVLKRIFGPKRDEVIEDWRKLHDEELQNLYSLPNIIRMMKSRRMIWVGHVARMGEKRRVYRVFVGRPEEEMSLEDLDVGVRILLKWISEREHWVAWTELM
jgi:hypothetical protein